MNKAGSIAIIPSLLAADFSDLKKTLRELEKESVEWIHLDIMDGHFVPNITFGPFLVKQIHRHTSLKLEAHLMITHPVSYADPFLDAGVDRIIPHLETFTRKGKNENLASFSAFERKVKKAGVELGLALNPKTSVRTLEPYLSYLDFILVMTVPPGFCAQAFDSRVLPKLPLIRLMGWAGDLAVDGGITFENMEEPISKGANVLVCGSALFNHGSFSATIRRFRKKTSQLFVTPKR